MNMQVAMRVRVALLFGATALGGCSHLGVGEQSFACPGRPAGVRCASATDVYKATESRDAVDATSIEALGSDPEDAERKLQQERVKVGEAAPTAPQATTNRVTRREAGYELIPDPGQPVPVRTPARVLRALIAPWDDTKGVLHPGGKHFKELAERQWSIGEQAVSEPVRFFTLQQRELEKNDGEDPPGTDARAGKQKQ